MIACCGLAVGALDVAPEQQVELLVGAPQLDVRVDRHRVIALQQRVQQLEHRDRLARLPAFGEVLALEQLRGGRRAHQPEQVDHRHVQPLAVAPHLQPCGVLVEDPQRLLLEGRRVRLDLLGAEHRAQRRAPRGVADARGVVADDQHHHGARRPGTRAACPARPRGRGGCPAPSGRCRASPAAAGSPRRASASFAASAPSGS